MSISFIIIAAFLCEALIETFLTIYENGKINWKRVLGVILGMILCWAYTIDLLYLLGFVSPVPFIGTLLTGILISRGANGVHDLLRIVEGFKNGVK